MEKETIMNVTQALLFYLGVPALLLAVACWGGMA